MGPDDLPRFNIPYELGLDIGSMEYGSKKLQNKKILILEAEEHHYKKVISDIAGQDIYNHDNNPKTLVRKVRNWFSAGDDTKMYPSATEIWAAYNEFYSDLIKTLLENGYATEEIKDMPVADFIKYTRKYIADRSKI